MSTVAFDSTDVCNALRDNPRKFIDISTQDLFSIDWEDLEQLQLDILQRQFASLRPKIKVLDRQASQVGIDEINSIDDLVPLGLPHTFYKAYSAADIQNGRYDKMTRWLQTLTSYDITSVNLDGCDLIEDWIVRLESATPIRPVTSSGTSGKISVVPKGLPEEEMQVSMFTRFFEPFGDEYGIDLRGGDVPLLCPWPSDQGRQAFIHTLHLLREACYQEHPELIKTVGRGRIIADELQLASRLARAQSLGEELVLSPREQKISDVVAERNRALPDRLNQFVDEVVPNLTGQKVVLFGFWTQIYQLAVACKAKGVTVDWSRDSLIVTGGGTKGFTFPDGWRDVLDEVFPFRLREVFGMTETTAGGTICSHNHIHTFPWGIKHVVDPETGESRPRKGVQTGRLMVHDLLAESFWPTTLTGDLVTLDFDGGCGCRRKGPFFHNTIQRLGAGQGDDKITCAKTPQAYEKLEEFSLGGGS